MRIARSWPLIVAFALLAVGCSTPAPPAKPPAEDTAPPAAPADEAAPQSEVEVPVIEKTRESVRAATEWLARGVDSWFGNIPFERGGGRVTHGRLEVGALHRRAEGNDFNVRFDARARLPNVERSVYAFVGRDDRREVVADTPDALSRQQRLLETRPEDQAFFAGLGLPLGDVFDFRLGFRGGLKPYAQARYRDYWPIGDRNLLEFRETIFWALSDRLGSTTVVSLERAVSPTLGLRWLNAATITQRTRNFELSSVLGAYQGFGNQRLLSLEAIVIGRPGTGVRLSDYGVQTKWEQPVYKDWLLGEVIVGHFWPRNDPNRERVGSWAFGGNLKMRF